MSAYPHPLQALHTGRTVTTCSECDWCAVNTVPHYGVDLWIDHANDSHEGWDKT